MIDKHWPIMHFDGWLWQSVTWAWKVAWMGSILWASEQQAERHHGIYKNTVFLVSNSKQIHFHISINTHCIQPHLPAVHYITDSQSKLLRKMESHLNSFAWTFNSYISVAAINIIHKNIWVRQLVLHLSAKFKMLLSLSSPCMLMINVLHHGNTRLQDPVSI